MTHRDKRQPPPPSIPSSSSIKREVYLEAGSKIDLSDSVKEARKNKHVENAKVDRRDFKLAAITTVLLFCTAAFSLWQSVSSKMAATAATSAARIAQQTLEQSNRS